ncbi:MAG: hypothetical protein UY34_C0033G0020 [Parcubacteria group bacterium GW2011_GWA2_48_9]|nr:MAG: hypothetical protein UY34_C0033G0020 [Parcubacteria group bacterium GW2011_GWA2_48_9]
MTTEPNKEPKMQGLPPEEADLQERITGFNKELLPLLGKYEIGLAAMAKILPDGRVAADPVVVSVRKHAAKAEVTPGPKVEGGLANPDA